MAFRLCLVVCVLGVVPLVLSGCTKATDEPRNSVITETFSTPEARNQFTEGSNHFAIDLFHELREKEGNLVVSPVSIATALGMALAGARGETEQQIAAVLHTVGLSTEEAHQAAADLQNDLNGRGEERAFTLTIANQLWAHDNQPIREEFPALVKKHYGAEIGRVDFVNARHDAVARINNWVARATHDKIPAALKHDDVDDLTRLVLVNAVFFLGKWEQPFESEYTRRRDFFRSKDDKVKVPMMHHFDHFSFAHIDGLKLLRLPYQGSNVSMLLILPDDIDGLAEVEARITVDNLRIWKQAFKSTEVDVALPKFKFEGDLQLNALLAKLGMPLAFDVRRADFSGVGGSAPTDSDREKPLFLQQVIHRALVEIDEEGTEAAAVTVTTTTTTAEPGEPPPPPPEFHADHPFLFLIQDGDTRAILFMGRVADPSKG